MKEPSLKKLNESGPRDRFFKSVLNSSALAFSKYYDRRIELVETHEDRTVELKVGDFAGTQAIAFSSIGTELKRRPDERILFIVTQDLSQRLAQLLSQARPWFEPSDRIVVILRKRTFCNSLKPAYKMLEKAGFRTFSEITFDYLPWNFFGLERWGNKLIACLPRINRWSLSKIAVIRVLPLENHCPSLSIVIPVKNERGNLNRVFTSLPKFPGDFELIFVEGNSKDGSWEELQKLAIQYKDSFDVKILKQHKNGKNDAVMLGFEQAKGELVVILDADLTLVPQDLLRFYRCYIDGQGDFVNGSRLELPMQKGAMRPLNLLGNHVFAGLVSFVLATRLTDSLCGTKLFRRSDLVYFRKWLEKFGDFDPFGDFNLLFAAASIHLEVVNLPIRYGARTYGTTNIFRFRHGAMLLRMLAIGFFKLRFGKEYNVTSMASSPEGQNEELDSGNSSVAVSKRRAKIEGNVYLREAYKRWYKDLVSDSSIFKNVENLKFVELGCGPSFLEEFVPSIVKTDAVVHFNSDLLVNAERLPFADSSLRGIFMTNTFHHFEKPGEFLSEAVRVLAPEGWLLMIEPANSWISRLSINWFHPNEFFDDTSRVWENTSIDGMAGANNALPWIIFVRDQKVFEKRFPGLKVVSIKTHTFLPYLIGGGHSYSGILPQGMSKAIFLLEGLLQRLFPSGGSMMSIRIQKK